MKMRCSPILRQPSLNVKRSFSKSSEKQKRKHIKTGKSLPGKLKIYSEDCSSIAAKKQKILKTKELSEIIKSIKTIGKKEQSISQIVEEKFKFIEKIYLCMLESRTYGAKIRIFLKKSHH